MKLKRRAAGIVGAVTLAAAGAYTCKVFKRNAAEQNCDGRGQTVLITGGSGGIGKALGEVFACHHFDLVLAARNADKLDAVKKELEEKYSVRVDVIAVNLASQDGARYLYDEIKARGITLDQFVNNAGAGKSSNLIDTDEQVLLDLMNLNVVSGTLLCRLIGADMVQRGKGKILNVASISSFMPDPGLNIYGPTKAYDRFLSEAMSGELQGSGVMVSALCPGPVKTNWSTNAGRSESRFSLDADEVAREAFKGMQAGDLLIIPSLRFKMARAGLGLLPEDVKIRILGAIQKRLRK